MSLPITSDIYVFDEELIPDTNYRSNVAMCLCKHTDLDKLSGNVICNTFGTAAPKTSVCHRFASFLHFGHCDPRAAKVGHKAISEEVAPILILFPS